jgi:hypothetical protein
VQKLLIHTTKEPAIKLEEKLRHYYDIQLDILNGHDDKNKDNIDVCEIKVKVKRDWSHYADLHPMKI